MKRKILIFVTVMLTIMLVSCTENERAKSWGGTQTINLSPNTKLVNATWKEANLWILTTEMTAIDTPKTYTFSEKSNLGMLEGTIIFVESKNKK